LKTKALNKDKMKLEEQNSNEPQKPQLNIGAVSSSVLMKYINMTREEEIRFISECINGKPRYSDSEIALGLAMMSISGK
jgi:hypothetical protein